MIAYSIARQSKGQGKLDNSVRRDLISASMEISLEIHAKPSDNKWRSRIHLGRNLSFPRERDGLPKVHLDGHELLLETEI